jgi:hypothetical protein
MQTLFPIPFSATEYGAAITAEVATSKLLIWSHIPTAAIGVLFALFIFYQTRKISAFYLLVTTICFAVWSYFELITWGAPQEASMFTWSLLDVFSVMFNVFTFWFLYSFIRGKDLPFTLKLITLIPIIPVYIYTIASMNIQTYFVQEINAIESVFAANYALLVESVFLITIIVFTIYSFRTAQSHNQKNMILLGGAATGVFLLFFVFSFIITNTLLFLGIGTENEAYTYGLYSLFGMPFMVGFLGYLIAKYQAFDLKLTKMIGLVVLWMMLLFLSIFI